MSASSLRIGSFFLPTAREDSVDRGRQPRRDRGHADEVLGERVRRAELAGGVRCQQCDDVIPAASPAVTPAGASSITTHVAGSTTPSAEAASR